MTRRPAASAHAGLVLAVVVAPAVVVVGSGGRAGAGWHGADLVLVGTLVGVAAAVLARRRLTAPAAGPAADRWIAALAGLAVLATAASAVPLVAFHWLTRVPGTDGLAAVLWGATLAVAVAGADAVQRRLPRWLSPVPEGDDGAPPATGAPLPSSPRHGTGPGDRLPVSGR